MTQPPSFIDPSKPTYVCQLHEFLYGLKQAPRTWYDKLVQVLLYLGFTLFKSDTSLFIHKTSTSTTLTFILVYVDDIFLLVIVPYSTPHFSKNLLIFFPSKTWVLYIIFLALKSKELDPLSLCHNKSMLLILWSTLICISQNHTKHLALPPSKWITLQMIY